MIDPETSSGWQT